MNSKAPPVPPENRSEKGPGEPPFADTADHSHPDTTINPDKKGHQGNSKVNTTHQGYQQDR